MIFISGTLALLVGGEWLKATKCYFSQPMWLYVACNIAMVLYVIYWLPESLSPAERVQKLRNQPKGVCNMVVSGLKVFVSKEYSRWRLWFAVFVMFVFYIAATGSTYISALFLLNYPLNWKAGLIGDFQALSELVHGLALLMLRTAYTCCHWSARRNDNHLWFCVGYGVLRCNRFCSGHLAHVCW